MSNLDIEYIYIYIYVCMFMYISHRVCISHTSHITLTVYVSVADDIHSISSEGDQVDLVSLIGSPFTLEHIPRFTICVMTSTHV